MKPAVDLPPPISPLNNDYRVSPSRKRRLLRRAEARRLFAEEAKNEITEEEQDVLVAAAEAEANTIADSAQTQENETSNEEICEKEVVDSCVDPIEAEIEEIDPDELKRDKIVQKVVVSSVTEPIEDKLDVEREVFEKFAAIGVKVVKFSGHANRRGKYET